MTSPQFAHLHLHTEHSPLDGACRMDRLMDRVKDLGMDSVGITDHGTMSGLLKFQNAADKAGVKPILGLEAYFTEDRTVKDPNNRYYHLTLLAENTKGYENLCRLSSRSSREGMYYKPRMDYELLKEHGEGLIVLTGCMASRTMQRLMDGDLAESRQEIRNMMECVGEENVYLELQNVGIKGQLEWNAQLSKFAKELGRPTVGTSDVHYLLEEDAQPHDAMLCVQMKTTLDNPTRMSLLPNKYYLRSPAEMRESLKAQPECLPTTLEIADRCDARIEVGRTFELLPAFPIPEDFDHPDRHKVPAKPEKRQPSDEGWAAEWFAHLYLREQVMHGLHRRYGSPIPAAVMARMEFEMSTVLSMGVTDYFLIVWDLLREAHERNIPTGPGRGCLVGSTNVWTPEGFKSLGEVEVGDQVLTHTGETTGVRKKFRYDVNEDLYTLRCYHGGEPITMTANHRVLAERHGIDRSTGHSVRTAASGSVEWTRADEIEVGDFVVAPRPRLAEKPLPRWDMADFIPTRHSGRTEYIVEEEYIVERSPRLTSFPLSLRDVSRRAGLTFSTLQKYYHEIPMREETVAATRTGLQRLLDEEGMTEEQWRHEHDLARTTVRRIPRYIEANERFCEWLGVFVGDGYVSREEGRSYYNIIEHSDERHVERTYTSVWGDETRHRITQNSTRSRSLWGTSSIIATFLERLLVDYRCSSQTKHLPEWYLELPQPHREALRKGLWLSDGHDAACVHYRTSSDRFAFQVRTLLWSLGIVNGATASTIVDSRTGQESRGWKIVPTKGFGSPRSNTGALTDEYLMMRVRQIDVEHRETAVYDLSTVNEDCSYMTDSMVVHNSGAGSMLLYALDVTQLDPLEHGLLFERFLNPDRISMPDVDQDISPEGRKELMDYMREKYGSDRVAQIITFGRIGSKAGIRRAAQALGKEYLPLADKLAKAIPTKGTVAAPLGDAMRTPEEIAKISDPKKKSVAQGNVSPELQSLVRSSADAKRIVESALWMEGMIQNEGVHAAALIVSPVPIDHVVPVQTAKDGTPLSAFDMKDAENVGCLKLDFLGLRNLDVIAEAERLIKRHRGEEIDAWAVPLDDKKTYDMLASGDSIGVFQFESAGMSDSLVTVGADQFSDLVAIVALYRPGPMAQIPVYARRKKGLEPITYGDPRLEEILGETQGLVVYQEQSMLVSRSLAGFTPGEADSLRKAIGKKLHDKMAELEPKFYEGCKKNGVAKAVIDEQWAVNKASADYSFNKSHAAAYALISYVTAYLKANYPAEYMAALLSSVMSTKDKVPFYLYETKKMGLTVHAPDVNASFSEFEPEGEGGIRFGLTAIKGVGEAIVDEIAAERDRGGRYKNLWDFAQRVDGINRREVDALVKAGAFDSTGDSRKGLLTVVEQALKQAKSIRKKKSEGQASLFDAIGDSAEDAFGAMELMESPRVPKEEYGEMEMFALEREVAGIYVSGHPLDHAQAAWEQVRHVGIGQISEEHIGRTLTVAGIITAKRVIFTRRDNKRMLVVTIEDLTGSREVVVFPRTLEQQQCERLVEDGSLVAIRVEVAEDDRGFAAQTGGDDEDEPTVKQTRLSLVMAFPFDPVSVTVPEFFEVRLEKRQLREFERVREVLEKHPGTRPVRITVLENGVEIRQGVLADLKVEPSESILADITAALGME